MSEFLSYACILFAVWVYSACAKLLSVCGSNDIVSSERMIKECAISYAMSAMVFIASFVVCIKNIAVFDFIFWYGILPFILGSILRLGRQSFIHPNLFIGSFLLLFLNAVGNVIIMGLSATRVNCYIWCLCWGATLLGVCLQFTQEGIEADLLKSYNRMFYAAIGWFFFLNTWFAIYDCKKILKDNGGSAKLSLVNECCKNYTLKRSLDMYVAKNQKQNTNAIIQQKERELQLYTGSPANMVQQAAAAQLRKEIDVLKNQEILWSSVSINTTDESITYNSNSDNLCRLLFGVYAVLFFVNTAGLFTAFSGVAYMVRLIVNFAMWCLLNVLFDRILRS